MMKRIAVVAAISALFAVQAFAALKLGDPAPDFNAPASLGGNVFTFSLAEALKKGRLIVDDPGSTHCRSGALEQRIWWPSLP